MSSRGLSSVPHLISRAACCACRDERESTAARPDEDYLKGRQRLQTINHLRWWMTMLQESCFLYIICFSTILLPP